MRLPFSAAVALTAALGAMATGNGLTAAAPNNRPPGEIRVSVTFHDNGGDRIQSDGGGTYQDRLGSVVAYISSSNNGSLLFGTENSATRTLRFFFDTCLSLPVDCEAPWSSLNEPGGLQGNVSRIGGFPTGGLMGMTTAEGEQPMHIKFNIPLDSDPAYWNVCFDSRRVFGPCSQDPSNTSTDARIRRIAPDEWTISANATDRGDLIKDDTQKKNRTYTQMGTYSMPFTLTVKCLNAAECPLP
jgi:hypothetical protein